MLKCFEYKKKLTSTASKPLKSLTKGKRSTGGRNSDGRITNHYRGGGNKRTFRMIDFKYDKKDVPATIETIEYDPNRTGFIALICYADGERRYILAPQTLKQGDQVIVSETAKPKVGKDQGFAAHFGWARLKTLETSSRTTTCASFGFADNQSPLAFKSMRQL